MKLRLLSSVALVSLAACGPVPDPMAPMTEAEIEAQQAETNADAARLDEERRADRDEAKVTLPPSTIERVEVPKGVTGRAPVPGLAVAHRCRKPGADDPASIALLQSSGDAQADAAFLRRPVTRPAAEARAAEPRCAIVVDVSPSDDPDPDAAVIPPVELDALRLSGDRSVFPADPVKQQILHDHKGQPSRLVVAVVFCIDPGGRVADIRLARSSGYLAYDLDLINAVATWRYKPYAVDGAPRSVCSVVKFIYNQK